MPPPEAKHAAPRTSQPRARVGALGALGGAWLVFFGRLIFSHDVPIDRDLFFTTLPLRQYVRERLLKGELPQWYPYEMLGVPFAGSLIDSIFHPQTLLLLVLHAPAAMKWTVLLAYLAALAGTYRLARAAGASRPGAVGGAYAMAFGGYAISMSNNTPYLVTLATAPWALAAAIRLLQRPTFRQAAVVALLFALLFLGGDAQMLLGVACLAGAALLLCNPTWRRTGLLALSAGLAALLAAVEILPSTVVGAESFRTEWKLTPLLGSRWALAPLRLPELIIPRYTPANWTNDVGRLLYTGKDGVWAASIFAGALVLGLMLLAVLDGRRHARAWGAVAVVAVWLALGTYGGLLPRLWDLADFLTKLRYPEKYLGFFAVAAGPLVALGLDALAARPRRGALLFGGLGLALLLTAWWSRSGAFVTWAFGAHGFVLPPTDRLWSILREAWTRGLFISGAFLLAAAAIALAARSRTRAAILVVPLVFVELFWAHAGSIPVASADAVAAIGPLAAALADSHRPGQPSARVLPAPPDSAVPPGLPADARVALLHAQLRADDGARAGIAVFGHNYPSEPARVLGTFFGKPPLDEAVWPPRFNVCYRVAATDAVLAPADRLVALDAATHLQLVRQPCLPRAFLASARPVANEGEAHDVLRQGLPETAVVWEGGPALGLGLGSVEWIEASPERLRLRVETDAPTALVVTDAFAAGWSASIDGHAAAIFPTDVAARGLALPAGSHQVELTYRTPRLRLGLLLSILGLGITAALLLIGKRESTA